MNESADHSDHEDTLKIASKEWDRTLRNAFTTGYRLGAEDGSDSVFQEGFNIGYEAAFKLAFCLGRYRGILSAMSKDRMHHPPDIDSLLNDKSGKYTCYLCKRESQGITVDDESLKEVSDKQKTFSKEIIQKVKEYVDPIIKESGITIDQTIT